MRILYYLHALSLGCTEKNAINNAIYLQSKGHDVFVFSELGGAREFELHLRGIKLLSEVDIFKKSWDMVHFHSSGLNLPILKKFREKFPYTKLILTNVFGGYSSLNKKYLDGMIFVSNACAAKFFFRLGRQPKHSAVIYNMVWDHDISNPTELSHNNDGQIVVGRVGRNDITKWSFDIADIINSTDEKYFKFKLVGCPDEIKREIVNRNVEYIEQITSNTELNEFYSTLDVLLHTSRFGESFGCIFVEAANHGIISLTKATPLKLNFWSDNAQAEIVAATKIGLCARTNYGLLKVLDRVRKHGYSRYQIYQNGLSIFNIDKIGKDLLLFYDAVLSGKPHKLGQFSVISRYLTDQGKTHD